MAQKKKGFLAKLFKKHDPTEAFMQMVPPYRQMEGTANDAPAPATATSISTAISATIPTPIPATISTAISTIHAAASRANDPSSNV